MTPVYIKIAIFVTLIMTARPRKSAITSLDKFKLAR
jgi:hypothetical protein